MSKNTKRKKKKKASFEFTLQFLIFSPKFDLESIESSSLGLQLYNQFFEFFILHLESS